MFKYLWFKSDLKKPFNQKEKIQRGYSKDIRKARQEKKTRDEIDETISVEMVQEEIGILITNYLRANANRLLVPLPEYDDEKMWTKCDKISQQKVLSTRVINTTKSAIRKEHKERFELILMIAASLNRYYRCYWISSYIKKLKSTTRPLNSSFFAFSDQLI